MLLADPVNIQIERGFEYGVIHCRCLEPTSLISFIESHINNFHYTAQELLELGSVYVNEQRTLQDQTLKSEDYIRIHRKPRRFPAAKVDWKSQIHFENENFVVIDKPSGIPCHPTVDNIQENILKSLKKSIGQEFYITHRLDVPTQGLLILAKTKEAQRKINTAFAERQIKKIYQAWSENKIEPGHYEHHMIKSPRAPKTVVSMPTENTEICQMLVQESQNENFYFKHRIELLTGRTHQIRAQMAHLGAPLLGDEMYGALPSEKFSSPLALWCTELEMAEEIFGAKLNFKLPFPKLKT